MTPTTGKSPWSLRPIYRVGLGFVVVGMLVLIGLDLARPRPEKPLLVRPGPRHKPIPVIRISEGPPMAIDADELEMAGRERQDNLLKMVFCRCPPGRFSMGGVAQSRSGHYLNGGPVWVTLSRERWIGKFEVTQAQWQQVMGKDIYEQRAMDLRQPRPLGDDSRRPHAGFGPDYPIYFTSFQDAEEFCHRLTEAERRAGRLEAGWIYRLPTEAEWEFACRAGTTTATAYGNQLDSSQANFDGEVPLNKTAKGAFLRTTRPVGSYPPTPGACTICTGTSGNGAATTDAHPSAFAVLLLGNDRSPNRRYAAEAGTIRAGDAYRQRRPACRSTDAARVWASAWHSSPPRSGARPKPARRRPCRRNDEKIPTPIGGGSLIEETTAVAGAHVPEEFFDTVAHHLPPEQPRPQRRAAPGLAPGRHPGDLVRPSSSPGAGGRTSRRNRAAPAAPPTASSGRGRRTVSGAGCTPTCWRR